MKQLTHESPAVRRSATPKNASITPSFFVLAEVGQDVQDESYPVPDEWSDAYHAVANALMELLCDDADVARLSANRKDQCMVLGVESRKFPAGTAIVGLDHVKRNLKPLVLIALNGTPSLIGPLLTDKDDARRGQLFATVVIREHLQVAKEYCDRVKRGEASLPDQGDVKGGKSGQALQIRSLLDEPVPSDLASLTAQGKQLISLAKAEVAARLGPVLSRELATRPHESYAEKQASASWVNAELRQLGLAIRCPKTHRPAILVADVQGGGHDISRFRLEIRDEEGNKKRTFTSQNPPELELMEDAPRQEPIAKWSERARRKSSGPPQHG